MVDIGRPSPLWAAPFPRQVVLGCIIRLAKHEPENEAANEPASSMFSALTSCRATL